MTVFDVTVPPGTPRGRTVKFTPERIEQIRNLVERGHSREQIAEAIGVTVGSLQVTCSRLGISLRRPKTMVLAPSNNGGHAAPTPPRPAPAVPVPEGPPLSLRLRHGGRTRDIPIPLPPDVLTALILQAAVNAIPLGQLVARILTDATKDKP